MSGYQFALKNGRKTGVSVLGEPTATRLVVMCLPTRGAGAFDPDPSVSSQHAVRVVCIDRPGDGGSEPLPEDERRSIELFADDIADYLRHTAELARGTSGLELGPAAIVGWSIGGVVALAAAGRHPEILDRLVVVGAPRPKHVRRGERYSPVAELRKRGVERSRTSLVEMLDEGDRPSLSTLGLDVEDADKYGSGTPGRIAHRLAAARLQGAAGVSHFVMSSMLHAITSGLIQHEAKRDIEEHLLSSGLDFTILQPANYMLGHRLKPAFERGVFELSWSLDRLQSMVQVGDVAEVAALVLNDSARHVGATYELVAPGRFTAHDIAKIISQVVGAAIQVDAIDADTFARRALAGADSTSMTYELRAMRAISDRYGSHDFVGNPNVLTWLLGRTPTTVDEWVREEYAKYRSQAG